MKSFGLQMKRNQLSVDEFSDFESLPFEVRSSTLTLISIQFSFLFSISDLA